jgi:hypothetical protein
MPQVKMIWYDGELKPALPPELEPGMRMGDKSGGVLFVGEKGKIVCGCYGKNPTIIPQEKMIAYKKPEKTIPRVDKGEDGHHQNWITACKGGTPACSNFDYAGPLTETILLGNVAIRAGRKIFWDGKNIKVTNLPEANQYIRREYRQGWEL